MAFHWQTKPQDEGHSEHLIWIGRFQWLLLVIGLMGWFLRSPQAALVYGTGGLCSMLFWFLHVILVGKLLTPSVKQRWFYGLLAMLKLSLIVLLLRGMMRCFPQEGLALVTGVLLFVAAILLEATRLLFYPSSKRA